MAVGAEDVFIQGPGIYGVRGRPFFQTLIQGEVKEGVDRMLAFGCGYFSDGASVVLVVSLMRSSPER